MISKYSNIYILTLMTLISIGCGKGARSVSNFNTLENPTKTTNNSLVQEKEGLLNALDREISQAGLRSLRKSKLESEDLEVRVWIGFGYPPLRGLILKKSNEKWVAEYLPPHRESETKTNSLRKLEAPIGGWTELWKKLETQDIFSNKDDSEVGAVEPFEDSRMVIIESLIGKNYKTYSYNAPCYSKAEEAKKVINILKILEASFEVDLHKCSDN